MGFRTPPTATLATYRGAVSRVVDYPDVSSAIADADRSILAGADLACVRNERGIMVYACDRLRSWAGPGTPAEVAGWGHHSQATA